MSSYRSLPHVPGLPAALYRAEQVQAMDKTAIEAFSLPGEILMERAGEAAFAVLRQLWPEASNVLVVTGTGNNAGDGFVLARLAHAAGMQVRIVQLGEPDRLRGDAWLNARRFDALSEHRAPYTGSLPEDVDVVVDAVFGTGLRRAVTGRWADALEAVNRLKAPVLALERFQR